MVFSSPAPTSRPLACVSGLEPDSGVDVLLAAFGLLAGDRPGLELEVVGSGPLAADLRAEAAHLGLDGRVHVRWPLPTLVRGAVQHCSVYVQPGPATRRPGRSAPPPALLAALAAGRPVVTADPGWPDLVHHGETGLRVPPGDPAALALAVAGLLDDPAHAEALGGGARRLVAGSHRPVRDPVPGPVRLWWSRCRSVG